MGMHMHGHGTTAAPARRILFCCSPLLSSPSTRSLAHRSIINSISIAGSICAPALIFTPSEPGCSTLLFDIHQHSLDVPRFTLHQYSQCNTYIQQSPNGPRPGHHILSLATFPSPTIEHHIYSTYIPFIFTKIRSTY